MADWDDFRLRGPKFSPFSYLPRHARCERSGVQDWSGWEQANICACSHSMAAHLMTDDGMCGFCFCRRHLHTRRSLADLPRPQGKIVVDALPPPPFWLRMRRS